MRSTSFLVVSLSVHVRLFVSPRASICLSICACVSLHMTHVTHCLSVCFSLILHERVFVSPRVSFSLHVSILVLYVSIFVLHVSLCPLCECPCLSACLSLHTTLCLFMCASLTLRVHLYLHVDLLLSSMCVSFSLHVCL